MATSFSLGAVNALVSTTIDQQASSLGALASCAARTVKGQNQSVVRETARIGAQRAVKDLNIRHHFVFGRKTVADANLTDGTATYDLPSDFFKVGQVQLINTDGDPQYTLDYIPWEQWNHADPLQDETGRPYLWTMKSNYQDENIIVYPTPDADAATDWDLRLTYFTRIDTPNQDSDLIAGPEELEVPICLYAEAYVEQVHGSKAMSDRKMAEYREAVGNLKSSANSQPDERLQFRMGYYHDDSLNTDMYIKVK